MLFRKFHLSISTIVLMASLSAPGTAAAEDAQKKWGPHVDLEGKWGTERSLGEVDLFMPLAQNEVSLLFTDLRLRLDDHSSREGNFGLGFRTQMSNDWIAGVYGFFDIRRTPNDNTFHQATLGLEALTENNELRLNAYIPEQGRKDVTGTGSATPVITGAQFQIQTETPAQEAALAGFDIEAGQRFNLTPNWTLWAYAGGFHFDKSGYDNVTGPRGRLEFSRENLPYMDQDARLTLGVESQYDNVRKGQSFAIARLRVPLSSNKDSLYAQSALDKRMTDRITRDVDIVAGVQEGETITETAELIGENGIAYTDYTLVDANTADLRGTIDGAGPNSLVIVDGSAGDIIYNDYISMDNDGQTLSGGGRVITLKGAKTGATVSTTLPGTRPTLRTPINRLVSILYADNTVFTDITIAEGDIYSMEIFGSQNVLIKNTSFINDPGEGAINAVFATATLDNVTISDRSFGISSNDSTLTVNNTTIENVTSGIGIFGGSNLTVNNSSISNTTNYGIRDSSNGTLAGSGNTMTAIGGTACDADATTTGNLAYTLDGVPATCP
ncbi:MAG: inverse autotransporter beta domain-containing protein [Pseudomonadota bacterium]